MGKSNGSWEFFYENGQIRMKGKYIDNKNNGHWVHYYDNGKVKLDLYYISGMLEGILTAYDDKGNIIEQAEYAENRMVRQIR